MREKDLQKVEMGKRLREARESKGWTREQLAEKSELSVPFLADLELGNTGVRLDRFKLLCELVGASADYVLFGDTGGPAKSIAATLRGCDPKTAAIVEKAVTALVDAIEESK